MLLGRHRVGDRPLALAADTLLAVAADKPLAVAADRPLAVAADKPLAVADKAPPWIDRRMEAARTFLKDIFKF